MISVHFQSKPFNITVILVYAPASNAEEAEVEWFYKDLQDLLELTPPKGSIYIVYRPVFIYLSNKKINITYNM